MDFVSEHSQHQVLTPEQLETLIADLNGSCRSIAECLPTGLTDEDLTEADHLAIDQQIFLCDTCGWWMELHEEDENSSPESRICEDCAGNA